MTEKENEQFWNSSIDEIKKGYIEDDIQIKCLICGKSFIKGKIYPINNEFYDAKRQQKFILKLVIILCLIICLI